jgi:hypothetical protein
MAEPDSDVPVVRLRTGIFWRKEGILYGESLKDAEETLTDAREQLMHQRGMLIDSKAMPFVMDIRLARSLSRDARTYFAGEEAHEVFSATALIIDSPLSRTLGNFFLGLNRTRMPTRLFTSTPDGVAWLRTDPK